MSPDYVWHLEDVLDLYAEPDDPRYPQVCFDESPVQLTSETRHPLPARPGQPARYDSEYKREGTANLFLFVQPLRGWRQVNVTSQRTKRAYFTDDGHPFHGKVAGDFSRRRHSSSGSGASGRSAATRVG